MLEILADVDVTSTFKMFFEGGQLAAILAVVYLIFRRQPKLTNDAVKRYTGNPADHKLLKELHDKVHTMSKKLSSIRDTVKKSNDSLRMPKVHAKFDAIKQLMGGIAKEVQKLSTASELDDIATNVDYLGRKMNEQFVALSERIAGADKLSDSRADALATDLHELKDRLIEIRELAADVQADRDAFQKLEDANADQAQRIKLFEDHIRRACYMYAANPFGESAMQEWLKTMTDFLPDSLREDMMKSSMSAMNPYHVPAALREAVPVPPAPPAERDSIDSAAFFKNNPPTDPPPFEVKEVSTEKPFWQKPSTCCNAPFIVKAFHGSYYHCCSECDVSYGPMTSPVTIIDDPVDPAAETQEVDMKGILATVHDEIVVDEVSEEDLSQVDYVPLPVEVDTDVPSPWEDPSASLVGFDPSTARWPDPSDLWGDPEALSDSDRDPSAVMSHVPDVTTETLRAFIVKMVHRLRLMDLVIQLTIEHDSGDTCSTVSNGEGDVLILSPTSRKELLEMARKRIDQPGFLHPF